MISYKNKKFSPILLIFIISSPVFAISSNSQTEALSLHNQLRHHHAAPAMAWDTSLAAYAEKYASHCQFKHSHGGYGENLAAGYPTVTSAINAWYGENEDYSYYRPGFSHRTGHFTQIVWKSTTKIGCATFPCHGKNGTPGNFLVCEYSPAGNVMNRGYFNKNVEPKQK